MTEARKLYFINTCIPSIVRDSIYIGDFPVDSDVFINFQKAFIELGYESIDTIYKIENGTILVDELKTLEEIDAKLNKNDIIFVFNSINEINFPGNNEQMSINISDHVKNKYKNSFVLSFIPDAHTLNKTLIQFVENIYPVSDKILTPYQDTENIFKMIHKVEKYSDKFHYIKNVPTHFSGDVNIESVSDKIYDVTFLGTARNNRVNAMKILLNIDFLSFKFDNTGRKFSKNNQLRLYDDFTKILNYSKFSICTPSTSFIKIAKLHDFDIFARPVFPARVAECIAAACIPVYIAENDEVIPLENIEANVPVLVTNIKNLENDFKFALHHYDFETTRQKLKQYHAQHLSSQAILKPILDEQIGRLAK